MAITGTSTAMNQHRPAALPNHNQWLQTTSHDQLASTLANCVAAQLRQALVSRPRASLAVSGGRTPTAMLQQLSQQPLDWQRVDITLADERWVDEQHSASNAALVKNWLLKNNAAKATFYPLYNGANSAELGQAHCQQHLNNMHWPLDVLVLGMGNDGHTASLFPLCPTLPLALSTQDRCVATLAPVEPTQRMSLSATTLLSAAHIHLHIEGAAKLQVLEQAIQRQDPNHMPIYTFISQPLNIHWCP